MTCVEVQMPTRQQVDGFFFSVCSLSLFLTTITIHVFSLSSPPQSLHLSSTLLGWKKWQCSPQLFRGSSFSACLWQHWIPGRAQAQMHTPCPSQEDPGKPQHGHLSAFLLYIHKRHVYRDFKLSTLFACAQSLARWCLHRQHISLIPTCIISSRFQLSPYFFQVFFSPFLSITCQNKVQKWNVLALKWFSGNFLKNYFNLSVS